MDDTRSTGTKCCLEALVIQRESNGYAAYLEFGYNPAGVIANPWRATGDLTNRNSDPVSGQLYTVR